MRKIPVAAGTAAVAWFLQAISTDYRLNPKKSADLQSRAKSRLFHFQRIRVYAEVADLRPLEKMMNEKVQRAEITTKPALYRLAGMEDVRVVPDIVYGQMTPVPCPPKRAGAGNRC
jgi:hypothetical protein